MVSAAVDRYLEDDDWRQFQEHSRNCPPCRCEYEGERATKHLIHSRLIMVRTPEALAATIHSSLQRAGAFSLPISLWLSLWRHPLFRPALAFAATFAIVLQIARVDRDAIVAGSPAPFIGRDVIYQSLTNFRAVERGEIAPEVISDRMDDLRTYFAGRTDYPVVFPDLHGCALVGGVLHTCNGHTLAHMVFRRNGELIYLYQTCWKSVGAGKYFCLADQVRERLVETGWFADSDLEGHSLVLRTEGETLLAFVSHLNQQDLLGCTSAEGRLR
jgi:hypothetical protein